ncbi:hypothetical protein ACFL47_06225 [Candidatus Latescibacterota bacterium]
MKLKHAVIALLLLAAVCILLPSSSTADPVLSEKIDLRILYAGHPQTVREKDYVDFLSKYFTKVEAVDATTLTEKQADGFDVVVIDYDGEGFKPRLKLPDSYSRATVTVGVPGALLCGALDLKTGYM